MRLACDHKAPFGIALIRATPRHSRNAAIFLGPNVALKEEHFPSLRRHELGRQRDAAVMHGQSLRLGIKDRGLTRERAIWLQVRPTRWPKDAPISEANEFLR